MFIQTFKNKIWKGKVGIATIEIIATTHMKVVPFGGGLTKDGLIRWYQYVFIQTSKIFYSKFKLAKRSLKIFSRLDIE